MTTTTLRVDLGGNDQIVYLTSVTGIETGTVLATAAGEFMTAIGVIGFGVRVQRGQRASVASVASAGDVVYVGSAAEFGSNFLPAQFGEASKVLTTPGPTGAAAFDSTGGGGGSPAGPDTAVQFNDNGAFGGDAGLTYDTTTGLLGFLSGGGLSFPGSASPITVVGGDDGFSDTAIIVDNPTDSYIVLWFKQFTDILGPSNSAIELFDDNVKVAATTVTVQGALFGSGGGSATDSVILKPVFSRGNYFQLSNAIHSGDTEYDTIIVDVTAKTDSGTNYFETFTRYNGFNGSTTAPTLAIGGYGHYTSGGSLSDYALYAYNEVTASVIWQVTSTFPTTFQLGAGMDLAVTGSIFVTTAVTALNGGAFRPDTTTGHTALLQAYDVDGAAYKTFGTLTNGNTPDFTLAVPSGATMTVQASTYKSSDGSTGATGTANAANTLTIKNGLVVNIA